MTRSACFFILILVLVACGGVPSIRELAEVQGVWTGTVTIVSGTPDDNCVVETELLMPPQSAIALSLVQTDSVVSGQITEVATGLSCELTGTVGLDAITLNVGRCDMGCERSFECTDLSLRDVCSCA